MANTLESMLKQGDGAQLSRYLSFLASNKKPTRNQRFAEISFANLALVDDLVAEAQKLAKAGHAKEGNRLLKLAQKVLENNRNYQALVGEVLSDGE